MCVIILFYWIRYLICFVRILTGKEMISMLYPYESETREVKELSGVWRFKADTLSTGNCERWYEKKLVDTIPMPVPASYNDITQDMTLRDHIGDVWYEKMVFIPQSWSTERVVIRVGSASHHAVVWVNGSEVTKHKGGFLPFEVEISEYVKFGKENRVTICVNNILQTDTIPLGKIVEFKDEKHPEGYKVQEYYHDFFNYAGIHRPVKIYKTSKTFIDDITIVTSISGNTSFVDYTVELKGENPQKDVRIQIVDEDGNTVGTCGGKSNTVKIHDANLWNPGDAYLYQLKVEVLSTDREVEDCYYQPFGIRTVQVTANEFLINGKPFYFKGFGKHEDMDIKGKGLDEVMNVKDNNLLKWIGANSFRTSHNPYAEEILHLADREGIVVIDESPAVAFNFFNDEKVFTEEHMHPSVIDHHLDVMEALIKRDKNHPCVVMWCVANEAKTDDEGSVEYLKKVAEKTRQLDPSRPITNVITTDPSKCLVTEFFDMICLNRYYGWYTDFGQFHLVEQQLSTELEGWRKRFNKPLMMTEFGADTIAGFHSDPPVMFSEEYQCEILKQYHLAMDKYDFVIGEHVWNFADFATKQGVIRVGGNKKGVFTRNRQPKAAAHLLKNRWESNHKKW